MINYCSYYMPKTAPPQWLKESISCISYVCLFCIKQQLMHHHNSYWYVEYYNVYACMYAHLRISKPCMYCRYVCPSHSNLPPPYSCTSISLFFHPFKLPRPLMCLPTCTSHVTHKLCSWYKITKLQIDGGGGWIHGICRSCVRFLYTETVTPVLAYSSFATIIINL